MEESRLRMKQTVKISRYRNSCVQIKSTWSLKPWCVPYFPLSLLLSLHLYFLFKTEEVSVLEALAASGLRSIRYALEVPAVAHVVANDYSSEAYDNMCRNISHNSVDDKVKPSCREAR